MMPILVNEENVIIRYNPTGFVAEKPLHQDWLRGLINWFCRLLGW